MLTFSYISRQVAFITSERVEQTTDDGKKKTISVGRLRKIFKTWRLYQLECQGMLAIIKLRMVRDFLS
jgi:hypothetical protein